MQNTDLRTLSGEQLLLLAVYGYPEVSIDVDDELGRRIDIDLLDNPHFDSLPAAAVAALCN